MSICKVFSCVVGRGYLLWPVCSFGKTLLAFSLLHSVLQGQICLLLQVFLDFLFLPSSPQKWIWVLVLEGLIGLQRTIQLQLLQHYWSGHRLGILWYWMDCLGNEQRSFCHFWCWRGLLRDTWTARRSNQSILKEIRPEDSLEGLMLMLKLQYFGPWMWRTDSFEKTLMLEKIEGGRRRG